MITIYLIRHGEKVPLKGDPHLSKKGVAQARKTAMFFKNVSVDRIFTSPALRAKETAAIIAETLGLTSEVTPLLKERVNWGDDPSQSFDEFLAMWTKSSENRSWEPPVGESSISAGKRLESLIKAQLVLQIKSILMITHGGIITDYLRNIFSDGELNSYIHNFSKQIDKAIPGCSITCLSYLEIKQKPTIKYIANTAHLKSES